MNSRMQSAEQLQFLKEVYKKNVKLERGGNTLDMMQSASSFKTEDPKAYDEYYKRELRQLNDKLRAQKRVITEAFMDAERSRISRRDGDGDEAAACSRSGTSTARSRVPRLDITAT